MPIVICIEFMPYAYIFHVSAWLRVIFSLSNDTFYEPKIRKKRGTFINQYTILKITIF